MKSILIIFGFLLPSIAFGQCPKMNIFGGFEPDTSKYTSIIDNEGPTLYFIEDRLKKMKTSYIGAWGQSFTTVLEVDENEYYILIDHNLIRGRMGHYVENICCKVLNETLSSCFDYNSEMYKIELDSILTYDIKKTLEWFRFLKDKYINE